MRDPARIPRILELLHERWLEAPDQRLGQLVVNFLAPPSKTGITDRFSRVALAEDDEAEASLARGWEQFK